MYSKVGGLTVGAYSATPSPRNLPARNFTSQGPNFEAQIIFLYYPQIYTIELNHKRTYIYIYNTLCICYKIYKEGDRQHLLTAKLKLAKYPISTTHYLLLLNFK